MNKNLAEVKSMYILGGAQEVAGKMADYIEAGVEHFMMYFLDYPSMESMKTFAREIVPSL